MKYFILKPRAKTPDDSFSIASQGALYTYADIIEETDSVLADELRSWADREVARMRTIGQGVDVNSKDQPRPNTEEPVTELWRQPMFTAHDVLCCIDSVRWIAQQYHPDNRAEFFNQLRQSLITLEKDLQP